MISPFIRAHGYIPGPAERPVAAGVLAGALALVPFLFIAWLGSALSDSAHVLDQSRPVALAYGTLMVSGGGLYGWMFMRAANDRAGGWLFGISYGFVTWMLGPATVLQLATGRPGVVGTAAQFLFAAHIAYGLVLGVLYPRSTALVRRQTTLFSERYGSRTHVISH